MDLLELQMKIIPDVLKVMQERYRVLYQVSLLQPIGRRSLAQSLGITERVARAEVEFLKDRGLIEISAEGMKLSNEGNQVIQQLLPIIKEISKINDLEQRLQKKLAISKVFIVSGDSDENVFVKKEIGRVAGQILLQLVKDNEVVALTGGSTVSEVAKMIPTDIQLPSVLYVPARGGIGEKHEYLANTIVSTMARKTNSSYRLLHSPDQMSNESYDSLIAESSVQDLLKVIRSSGILLLGIGDAKKMAERRNSSKEVMKLLTEKNAVGEALGNYFSKDGEIVYKIKTIGLKIEDLKSIPITIAVAGGKSKADAILSVLKNNFKQILVTDEGAAKEILSKI
ncbi:MAG: sugar-binding transcriptional regulator [Vulcanibacillus sp.]